MRGSGDRRRLGRRLVVALVVAFVCGLALAGAFWRRQVQALIVRYTPYERRLVRVASPALIINEWSGDGKAERVGLGEAARKAGVRTVVLQPDDDLAALAHDLVSGGADAIGMAGGDGSMAAVAAVAMERDVPFFCVPVGTRNHFALDLGLDRDDPLAALEALTDSEEILIDCGSANGRLFVNNVSLGVYAQAVHHGFYREQKVSTLAETVAAAMVDIEEQAPVSFVTPDGGRHERAPLLLISNNPYRYSGYPDFGRRVRMDTGRLGVGAVTNLPIDADIATVTLQQLQGMYEWEAVSYRVESEEPILAGVDGEAVTFDSPLNLTIRHKQLRMLVPAGTQPGYVRPGEAAAASFLDVAGATGLVESAIST